MSKILVLFVATKNLGIYVNSITHFTKEYDVNHIKFISLIDSPICSDLNTNIDTMISKKLLDKYDEILNNDQSKIKEIEIKAYENARRVLSRHKQIVEVEYPLFKDSVKKIIGNVKNESVIFDISSLPKRLSVDIAFKLLATDFNNIFIFEIKDIKIAQNDVEKLYHNLLRNRNMEVLLF